MEYTISKNNVHIEESYRISKKDFGRLLDELRMEAFDKGIQCLVFYNRSNLSMELEWAVHNALYGLGICRSRTGSVDLDYPQKWYMPVAYTILGIVVWPFIK